MSFLKIGNLTKRFGTGTAVDGLNLSVERGEVLVVLGPSGCGKTTLLRLIAGLESPDCGEVYLDDRPLSNVEPHLRDVAMVFQSYALYPHMTARRNIEFGLRVRGVEPEQRNKAVADAAGLLGITHLLDKYPAQCSGGERQRVALGRAIVRRPRLFLFDEPLSNLDAGLREHLRVELRTLLRSLGATALYVTHDQSEAMTLADRIAVVEKGRLRQVASPREVYDDPLSAFVASFLGAPSINRFPGRATGGVFVADAGFTLPCPAHAPEATELMIRPEHLHPDASGAIEGSVVSAEYQGDRTVLHLHRGGTPFAVIRREGSWEAGSLHRFAPAEGRLLWFCAQTGERIG